MSVDIDWQKLTTGEEGARLAESVRNFIHNRFQQVPLPRFIRSVNVGSFDFGEQSPHIEVKDICNPLPDFYEDSDEASSNTSDKAQAYPGVETAASLPQPLGTSVTSELRGLDPASTTEQVGKDVRFMHPRTSVQQAAVTNGQPNKLFSPALFTPQQSSAIPGGTSSLAYFHLPYGAGISGPTTPLATMVGAHFQSGWPEGGPASHLRQRTSSHQHSASIGSETALSSTDPTSRPHSQHRGSRSIENDAAGAAGGGAALVDFALLSEGQGNADGSQTDTQVVAHVKYCGDMSLAVTAEIFLDYPMPSFVAIPLQLHITGFTFDGIAIVAYVKRKVHCCFMSPENANMFMDSESARDESDQEDLHGHQRPVGGLLEEVRVESEIGQKENGKQVLKNLGKVEKFVLEQVRRMFEDEFVFPSFWTFLV